MEIVYAFLPGMDEAKCIECGYIVRTIGDPSGPFQEVVKEFGDVGGARATVTAEVRPGLEDQLTLRIGVCDPNDLQNGRGYWANYRLADDLGCRGRYCLAPIDPAKVVVLEHGSPDRDGRIGKVTDAQSKKR